MSADRLSALPKRKNILHQGWLKKQGGMVKTWQKRWCVLAGEKILYYAKEYDDSKCLGAIPLKGNRVYLYPYNPDEPTKFLFEILPGEGQNRLNSSTQGHSHHDSYLLWANNHLERDEWVQHMRRVMHGRQGGGIFGQSLIDTITSESDTSTRKIPVIVENCIDYLKKFGLKEEGIFRLPGRNILVKELQEAYDCGKRPSFKAVDIHTVASLLKLYIKQLPEPLIPYENYEAFSKTLKDVDGNTQIAKEEIIKHLAFLPRVNYNLVKYLSEFLFEVTINASSNKMNIRNISTVFAPNFLRPNTGDHMEVMKSNSLSLQLVHLLVEESSSMFPENNLINFSEISNTSSPIYHQPHPPAMASGDGNPLPPPSTTAFRPDSSTSSRSEVLIDLSEPTQTNSSIPLVDTTISPDPTQSSANLQEQCDFYRKKADALQKRCHLLEKQLEREVQARMQAEKNNKNLQADMKHVLKKYDFENTLGLDNNLH